MSQIQIEITGARDQARFDQVLAQTVDMVQAADRHLNGLFDGDAMIIVHTETRLDNLVKIIKCSVPDALIFFAEAFGEGAHYA